MSEWIDILEVLAEMEKVSEDGHLFSFSISYVRNNTSGHGVRGSIKHVPNCAKYTKPNKKASVKYKKATSSWQFKAYNCIPIQDLDNNRLLTPKFTHIIEFNGKKVRHYGRQD